MFELFMFDMENNPESIKFMGSDKTIDDLIKIIDNEPSSKLKGYIIVDVLNDQIEKIIKK